MEALANTRSKVITIDPAGNAEVLGNAYYHMLKDDWLDPS